jgi:16S rRNA (guanine527-N7)-methyltransferase
MENDAPNVLVSRETQEQLEHFATLVRGWSTKINLVSPADTNVLYERHIDNCRRVTQCISDKTPCSITDLGSGGGFPGIIVAILRPKCDVTLIEADTRKAAFLRTARRELKLDIQIIAARIEEVTPMGADIVTARACAPLPTLLHYVDRHVGPHGYALLMKGKSWKQEVQRAGEHWLFEHQAINADTNGVILRIDDVRKRADV